MPRVYVAPRGRPRGPSTPNLLLHDWSSMPSPTVAPTVVEPASWLQMLPTPHVGHGNVSTSSVADSNGSLQVQSTEGHALHSQGNSSEVSGTSLPPLPPLLTVVAGVVTESSTGSVDQDSSLDGASMYRKVLGACNSLPSVIHELLNGPCLKERWR